LILAHLDLVSEGKDDFDGENSPGVPRINLEGELNLLKVNQQKNFEIKIQCMNHLFQNKSPP